MTLSGHVGIAALDAERNKLLKALDVAIEQAGDDPVKVEHGNVCEAAFRRFLEQFLPKKYGVTKGHIITPDLEYTGTLQQWDIIIYDQLESPVLFVREKGDGSDAGERGIPIEYVKAIIEVKASLTKASAAGAAEKIAKLSKFLKEPGQPKDKYRDANHLPYGFFSSVVFFQTKVDSAKEFSDALGELHPIFAGHTYHFHEGLIIRGQTHPRFSSIISHSGGANPADLIIGCDASPPVPYGSEPPLSEIPRYIFSAGFGESEFWEFMIDLVHELNGESGEWAPAPTKLIGGYGMKDRRWERLTLFPSEDSHSE